MRAAALLFIAAFTAWSQSGPLRTRSLSEQLLHAGTDERISTYEKLLASSPQDVKLQIGLISAYLQKLRETSDFGYLNRASKLVDRMLEADAGNFTAMRFQNEIDMQRHNFKAVAERAQDMAKYEPSDPGNWGNLADALMELGEYQRAGEAYMKMYGLRPGLSSYNRLAWYKFVTGDAATAVQFLRDAVDAGDPAPENTAWCLAELGDMYFKIGKLSEAAGAYNSALHLFPTLHRASAGLGRVEASQGQIAAAIRDYERAQSIVPLPDYAGVLEDLYSASEEPAKAARQRDLIATIEKLGVATNEKVNRNLALLLADHNRDGKLALQLIETELPTRPDVYTWDAYSWVLLKNGRLEDAQAASQKALKLATPEPVFYYHASQIAHAAGDEKAAREYAAHMASLNPHFDFTKTELASASVH